MASEIISIDLINYQDQLQTKKKEGKTFLFDQIRKKWLSLQPEELVRQLMIQYLITEKNYNANRFSLEKGIKVMNQDRRFDVLVFDKNMNPFVLIECKAPKVKISEASFSQIHAYNYDLKVPFLILCNGIQTYCYEINWEKKEGRFLDEIPDYPQ